MSVVCSCLELKFSWAESRTNGATLNVTNSRENPRNCAALVWNNFRRWAIVLRLSGFLNFPSASYLDRQCKVEEWANVIWTLPEIRLSQRDKESKRQTLFEAGTAEFIMNSKIFEESHNYLLVFVNFYPSSPPPQSFSCFVRTAYSSYDISEISSSVDLSKTL